MIDIKVSKLSTPVSGFNLISVTYNTVAENFASKLRQDLTDRFCEAHPNSKSTITVFAKKEGTIETKFTSVCCDSFKNLFEFTVKK